MPKRNRIFWLEKFNANISRDRRVSSILKRAGWTVIVVWECEAELNLRRVETRVRDLLR